MYSSLFLHTSYKAGTYIIFLVTLKTVLFLPSLFCFILWALIFFLTTEDNNLHFVTTLWFEISKKFASIVLCHNFFYYQVYWIRLYTILNHDQTNHNIQPVELWCLATFIQLLPCDVITKLAYKLIFVTWALSKVMVVGIVFCTQINKYIVM